MAKETKIHWRKCPLRSTECSRDILQIFLNKDKEYRQQVKARYTTVFFASPKLHFFTFREKNTVIQNKQHDGIKWQW